MTTLGTYIVEQRKHINMTQGKLSAASGCPDSTLRMYEKDESVPDIVKTMRIAEALGLDIQDFADALSKQRPSTDTLPVFGTADRFDAVKFGESLKGYRVLEEIPLADAAHEIGVATSTLASWEKGKHLPTLLQVIDLAEAYDVTVADLIEGAFYE